MYNTYNYEYMKWFFTFFIFILLFSGCKNASKELVTDKIDTLNLLTSGRFVGYTDSFGSQIDISKPFVENGVLTIDYKLAKLEGENYPWIDVECYLDDDISWSSLDSVQITYKSSSLMSVVLAQMDLLDKGESYKYDVAKASDWTTVIIRTSELKQPDWSASKHVALDMSQIKSIGFLPQFDEEYPDSGHFEVKEIIAYGMSEDHRKSNIEPIILNGINDNRLYYTVMEPGNYSLEIADSTDKVLLHTKSLVKFAGLNELYITKSLNTGNYKVRITSEHHKIEVDCDVSNVTAVYKDERY